MPSVTKCTVEPGRGQPSGTSCVTTKAGPQAWLPPQPSAISNVHRPVSIEPRPAVSSRRCRPLDSATRKVIGSAPPTGTSWSPEWKYQSKTAEGLSSGSATKPSSDMDIRAMTLDMRAPVRWSREKPGRDEGSPLWHGASLRGCGRCRPWPTHGPEQPTSTVPSFPLEGCAKDRAADRGSGLDEAGRRIAEHRYLASAPQLA